jgi:glycosyltransferase involved in cell wall biosynthesis
MPSESVSVIIPSFERWELLRRTLAGALAQRDVELEVVIVNDGRSEPPADLVGEGESRVRIVTPAEHRGVGHARNTGIEVAEGDWIALLDDDDLWSPEKLSLQLRACAREGAAWGYAAGVYVDERLVPFELLTAPPAEDLVDLLLRHQGIPGACSNIVVRADLLRETGGFDQALHQLSDWDLCLRLAERAPAAAVDEVLLAYIQHSGSMLITDSAPIFREYDRFHAKHRPAAQHRGGKLDPEAFAFWVTNRLEKAGRRRRAARESLYAGFHYREPSLLRNAARLAFTRPAVASHLAARSRSEGSPSAPPTPAWLQSYVADGEV